MRNLDSNTDLRKLEELASSLHIAAQSIHAAAKMLVPLIEKFRYCNDPAHIKAVEEKRKRDAAIERYKESLEARYALCQSD